MSTDQVVSPWSIYNIELWKLVISTITPVVGAVVAAMFAYLIAKSGVFTDQKKSRNQELIKQRMMVFNDVAPKVNEIYCYVSFVGPWRNLTPEKVIEYKRHCDQIMHVYKTILTGSVFDAYQRFIASVFNVYQGFSHTAQIRLPVDLAKRNWEKKWYEAWADSLSDESPDYGEIQASYNSFMTTFAQDLGVEESKGKGAHTPTEKSTLVQTEPASKPVSQDKAIRSPDQTPRILTVGGVDWEVGHILDLDQLTPDRTIAVDHDGEKHRNFSVGVIKKIYPPTQTPEWQVSISWKHDKASDRPEVLNLNDIMIYDARPVEGPRR